MRSKESRAEQAARWDIQHYVECNFDSDDDYVSVSSYVEHDEKDGQPMVAIRFVKNEETTAMATMREDEMELWCRRILACIEQGKLTRKT